ncbi:MAG: hypothetical protein H0S81_01360 [Desulfotignum balticum]|uniref:Uncharacterized protein n=1 Tax=Desulfotignum balticum TaxID=115781 RepID=A0A931CW90_9BACT|nr:hypothetical protein [Desulfotignum balticum]
MPTSKSSADNIQEMVSVVPVVEKTAPVGGAGAVGDTDTSVAPPLELGQKSTASIL